MISKANYGDQLGCIMYSQLVKELIKWEKCEKNMIEGITKREPKQDVCDFAIVLEVMFQKWFPLKIIEPHEKKKQIKQPQEDMRIKETLQERFVKNKKPLNPSYFFPKKEKQLETRTTKRAVLMS